MFRKDKKDEFYTLKAHQEGYPARSVYKLEEIDKKYHFFQPGNIVLDLGCAPGSWFIYIARSIGNQGKVVGLDIKNVEIKLAPNMFFKKIDILKMNSKDLENINKEAGLNGRYDSVVSDLAPKTCGIKEVDNYRSFELANKALGISSGFLKLGGNFICKIFEGKEINEIFRKVKINFKEANLFKPKASLKHSREIYLIGKGKI